MDKADVRKGMPEVKLGPGEFKRRFLEHFYDPAFDSVKTELDRVAAIAWDGYDNARKAPRTVKAGGEFADPDYDLSVEWLAASRAIKEAQARHDDAASPSRVLLINGSPRSEHTCPGEMSKTYRLLALVHEVIAAEGFECEVLDLSRITAEYGRTIHPCKSCVATAMPLCHWPCSCYPNHALGQVGDWMSEIYPKWTAAHGAMILCPVHWYQAPSTLKLMIDRLVCADGGNPDPSSTGGKDALKAKQLELKGWPYPRHLAGRVFSVVAHGDYGGAGEVRHALADWLRDIGMIDAGHKSLLGTYIGYLTPYATSHDDLDRAKDLQEDVRNCARALVQAVKQKRSGELEPPDRDIHSTRPK